VSSATIDQPRPDTPVGAPIEARSALPPLSRAGAIAAVLASGPIPRVLRRSARVALLVSGSVLVAVGVAVMLWTELGPGPLDVFIGAVRARTGVSLTVAVWLVIASLIGIAWLLGRRPGVGTLISPLIVGPVMQTVLSVLDRVDPPEALALAAVVHLLAVLVVGLGAGALIVSGLGAGSGELLASAASDRSGRAEPRVRMVFELTWLGAGVILGGPIGIGTVLAALTIGPAVAVGFRVVDAVSSLPGAVAEYCGGKQRAPVRISARR
jgi:uncharacterized membrane protein YczE